MARTARTTIHNVVPYRHCFFRNIYEIICKKKPHITHKHLNANLKPMLLRLIAHASCIKKSSFVKLTGGIPTCNEKGNLSGKKTL